jgi:hypothetical protein
MSTPLNPKSYQLPVNSLAATAAPTVIATIAPSASKAARVTGITVWNPGKATAAQVTEISLLLQTTAATGGTVATVTSKDRQPFPGVVRTGAVTAGTAGAVLARLSVFTPTDLAAFNPPLSVKFDQPIVLPANTTGLIVRVENGAAGYTDLDVTVDFEG